MRSSLIDMVRNDVRLEENKYLAFTSDTHTKHINSRLQLQLSQ